MQSKRICCTILKFDGFQGALNFVDKLSAFQVMLDLWERKINAGRLAMFSHLCSYCEDNNYEISESLKNDMASHLHSLKMNSLDIFQKLQNLSLH